VVSLSCRAGTTSHQYFFEPFRDVENFLLRDSVRQAAIFVPLNRVTLLIELLVRRVRKRKRDDRIS